MKAFHEVKARDLEPRTLQNEMNSKGYVLIRDLLPKEAVGSVLGDVAQVLFAAGWLSAWSGPEATYGQCRRGLW